MEGSGTRRIPGNIVLAILVGLTVLATAGLVRAQQSPAAAEITRVTGRAEILRNGQTQWIPAAVGAQLVERDEIRALAGASAELRLPDATTLVLAENSRIVMSRLQFDPQDQTRKTAIFHLVVGRVRSTIAQAAIRLIRARQSNFAISTPTAVAAVRGTVMVTVHTPANVTSMVAMLQDQGTCTDFTTLAPVVVLPGTLSSQVLHGPCAQPVFIPRGLRALFDTTINPDTAGAKELHGPATIVDPDLVDGITSQPLTAFAETPIVPFFQPRPFIENLISVSPSSPRQ